MNNIQYINLLCICMYTHICACLFIYLLKSKKQTETKIFHLSVHSLITILSGLSQGKAGSQSFVWVPHIDGKDLGTKGSPPVFPHTLEGGWITSRLSRTQSWAYRSRWHHRWSFSHYPTTSAISCIYDIVSLIRVNWYLIVALIYISPAEMV